MEIYKKILAASFEGKRPAQVIAAWTGEALMILEAHECAMDPRIWLENLLEDIARKKGWEIFVEDRTRSFPAPATSYDFNAPGPDGRPNIQHCLDWYFALKRRGALIFDDSAKRYEMREGGAADLIAAGSDELGRLKYDVRWTDFTATHRSILLAVAAACLEEPLTERWVAEFRGLIPEVKKPPIWPVFRVMNDWNRQRQTEFEARVEAHNNSTHPGPQCTP